MTVDVLVDRAGRRAAEGLALLAEGRFEEALVPLRLALSYGDARAATMLNLAIAEDHAGDRDHARRLMQTVAVNLPDWDEPILRLAESFRAAKQIAAAENSYRQALELNPNRREALTALGGLLLMTGRVEEARDLLLRGCGVAPDNAEAWDALGLALRALGEPATARTAFLKAQALQPVAFNYVVNGVMAALEAKEADAELGRLSFACDQDPLNPAYQLGRGVLLDRLGRRTEAIDALEVASGLAPDAIVPLSLLGGMLARTSRIREAEEVLCRLAALCPDNPYVANDHAASLMRLGQHPDARRLLLKVAEHHDMGTGALCNLANSSACCGLQDEAVATARRAISIDPDGTHPRRVLCTTLPYQDGARAAELLAAMRDAAAVLPRTPQPPMRNRADPNRPLIVGILSGNLRSHPVGWLTIAGFETLDPEQFSLVCLAQHDVPTDALARRFRAVSGTWVNVDAMSDAALAEAARALDIDILIDLGGYGDAGRMPACVNRLAPVQIKWVGMQSHSSGMPEMDWFVTDRWETPDGFEPLYSERLLRLSDGYICYSPPPYAPDVVALPALSNGFVTFGCFNNLAKITPRVIETWSTILRRLPDARLVLKTHQLSDGPTADRFRAAFVALGIAGDRVELRGSSGHRAFMGEYGGIDIVLDPFPYSGGLTTCEALWMGVPTITLPGEIFASRHSASHMSNAGLADWVAGSTDAYVEMAVERARDIAALAALRAGLRETARRSPLCDAPRFGKNLGTALRHAWRCWCEEATRADGGAETNSPLESGHA